MTDFRLIKSALLCTGLIWILVNNRDKRLGPPSDYDSP
jgi:hypothetical protein